MLFLSHGREESEHADDVGPSEDEDQGEEGNEGDEHGRVPRQPPEAPTSTANPGSSPCDSDPYRMREPARIDVRDREHIYTEDPGAR